MRWLSRARGTTVGLKMTMALSGLVLFLFVLGHMAGNLQVFAGQDRLNSYAASLRGLGPILWMARLILLAALVAHVASAAVLERRNRASRPLPYGRNVPRQASLASRTMLRTGLVILVFVIYHLLHFTFGVAQPGHFGRLDAAGRHDVYSMVVLGFQEPLVTATYALAMVLLGFHLAHGATSLVQTLGGTPVRWKGAVQGLGRGLAMVIVAGNLAMPLSILFRLVGSEVTP
jgi:succinate dehydrogenase / fumarate reductase cytochrome b subunit